MFAQRRCYMKSFIKALRLISTPFGSSSYSLKLRYSFLASLPQGFIFGSPLAMDQNLIEISARGSDLQMPKLPCEIRAVRDYVKSGHAVVECRIQVSTCLMKLLGRELDESSLISRPSRGSGTCITPAVLSHIALRHRLAHKKESRKP